MKSNMLAIATAVAAIALGAAQAHAQASPCAGLPSNADLAAKLKAANAAINLTLNFQMWATVVNADGTVCAVAYSGSDALQSQWLLSRVISAQKANTANALSLGKGLALSTANLWKATQPGGSLWELTQSNPVNTTVAYAGPANRFGTSSDPMVGQRIGGVNVFGGGLGLYNSKGVRVGGVGVSGDTSCRDHAVAWELRSRLVLDYVPAGLSPMPRPDNIIFDTDDGFGHPTCLDAAAEKSVANNLTPVRAVP